MLYKRWRKKEQERVDAKELRNPETCDMVVFDLELAGYAEDDIIEIAAIKVDFLGRQTAVFRELIRPRTKISKRVTEMTGITRDMVKDKPQLPEVLKRFLPLWKAVPSWGTISATTISWPSTLPVAVTA